jgi:hypothetical protein
MRKALNDNPMVQISVLGVGLILVGFLLFTRMSGGKEKTEVPPNAPIGATADASAAPAVDGAAPTGSVPPATSTPAAGTAAPVAGASGTTVAPTASVDPEAWRKPGPGLPKEVVDAWARGDVVALLVVRESGIDDRLVKDSARQLSGDSRVAYFVTPAEKVAKFSRITQAVGLNRVPALVVIRPKDVAGAPPQAQVSYGFRNAQSVVQTVRDAAYKGKDDVPYYPE